MSRSFVRGVAAECGMLSEVHGVDVMKKGMVSFDNGVNVMSFLADRITVCYWQKVSNPMEGDKRRKQTIEPENIDGGSHFKCVRFAIGSHEYPVTGHDMYRIEGVVEMLKNALTIEASVEGETTFEMRRCA